MSGTIFHQALSLASKLEEREMAFFLLNCQARGLADLSKSTLETPPVKLTGPLGHPWKGSPLETLLSPDGTYADAKRVKVMKSRLLAKLRKDTEAARALAVLGFAGRDQISFRRYRVCSTCRCTIYVEVPPHATAQPGEAMLCPVCVSGRLSLREIPDELKIWGDRRKELLFASVENKHEIDAMFRKTLPLARRQGGLPGVDFLQYLEQFGLGSSIAFPSIPLPSPDEEP